MCEYIREDVKPSIAGPGVVLLTRFIIEDVEVTSPSRVIFELSHSVRKDDNISPPS